MKNHYITVEVDVPVNMQSIINELEFEDIYGWIGDLSAEEKAEFVQDLPECFEDVSLTDLLGGDLCLEEALEVIVKAWNTSPYLRYKIQQSSPFLEDKT